MANLNSLIATTLNTNGKVLHDNVFKDIVVYEWLKMHGRVKPVAGGLNITEDIEVSLNTSVDFRDLKAKIPLAEQDVLQMLYFAWKGASGGLPIFDDDELMNMGDARIIDLSEAMIKNLMNTLKEKIALSVFAVGGEGLVDGLPAICSATNVYPTADTKQQVTGINRATAGNEYWQANVLSTAERWSLNGGTDGGWAKGYNLCTKGSATDQPDLIVCSEDMWEMYDQTLLQNQRFEDPKLAEAGFRSLMYKGAAVVWDAACVDGDGDTTGVTYILNTKHMALRPHTSCVDKFIVKAKHEMEDYLANRILVAWKGNMTCTSPRRQCLITNKTTS